jgi:hypothetical protein
MKILTTTLLLALTVLPLWGQGLDPAVQAKVDAQIKLAQAWAAEPALVNAVKASNGSGPAGDYATMTQDKWKSLSILDPAVRSFSKNAVAELLKGKKSEAVSEAFVSAAAGTKVAFLTKPTNWSHKGKSKHDAPMAGKTWQGAVEVDDSTGLQQVQIGVPILDDGKPIGSLVVGLSLSKLN